MLTALRLERGRATKEGGLDYNRIVRHLSSNVDESDIDTVLAYAQGLGYVQSDGSGGYTLTTAGQNYYRANRVRGSRVTVA